MANNSNPTIKIEQTTNGEEIGNVWLKDSIWERTADFKAAEVGKGTIQAVLNLVKKDDDHIFLAARNDKDELVGIVSAHSYRDSYEIHPVIPEEYRMEYAHTAIGKAIEWVYENKNCDKVYCQIPSLFKPMLHFAMKRGFEIVEIKEKAKHHNDGKYYDVYILELEKSRCQV